MFKPAAFAVSAALLALVSFAPAQAAPSGSALKQATSNAGAAVEHVQYKRKKAYRKGYRDGRRHHRYRAGRHYRHAPPGWRRYSARPYGWRTRGCVVVGPVWFCP